MILCVQQYTVLFAGSFQSGPSRSIGGRGVLSCYRGTLPDWSAWAPAPSLRDVHVYAVCLDYGVPPLEDLTDFILNSFFFSPFSPHYYFLFAHS